VLAEELAFAVVEGVAVVLVDVAVAVGAGIDAQSQWADGPPIGDIGNRRDGND